MMRQRVMAFALVATAGAVLAFTSHRYAYPAVISAVALAGVPGRLMLALTPAKKNILLLSLAAVFVAQWNISPYQDGQTVGFIFFPLSYAAAQYLLAMMTVHLYLRLPGGLPPALPLMGCLALVCAGNIVTISLSENRAYQLLVLAHVGAAALYYVASRQKLGDGPDRGDRRAVLAGLLAGGLLLAWLAGAYVRNNANELQRYLVIRRRGAADRSMGFAEAGRLTSVNILRTGEDQTVLWVQSPVVPGYLRGAAMERFRRSAWDSAGTAGEILPVPTAQRDGLKPPGANEFLYVWGQADRPGTLMTIHPRPEIPVRVFAPLETQAVYAPVERLSLSEHQTASSGDLAGGLGYRAWVPRSPPTSSAPDADLLSRCLAPPDVLDPRVAQLAGQILAGRQTAQEKIRAVTDYLTTHYTYSLSIAVPRGADPLAHFLLEAKAAHCEYFASAAAVLLRQGGVPARYVTGFVAQRYNDVGRCWYARNGDAHAWVEAWDDAARRWVTVEATPPDGRPGHDARSWLANLWDYVLFRLQQLREAVNLRGWAGLGLWVLGVLVELLGLLVLTWPGRALLAVILVLIARRFWRRRPGRARPRAAAPELQQWRVLLARMDAHVRRLGFIRAPSETLHQFASRLAGGKEATAPSVDSDETERLSRWYAHAAQIRYDGEITTCQLQELDQTLNSGR